MRIRFYNCRILSMDGDLNITKGEIHTDGEKIAYVGTSKDNKVPFDKEIDCENNLLMPSFKNMHTHSAMTFLRSQADDEPLQKWLTEVVFPAEAKLTEEKAYWYALLAIAEYLRGGISTCGDMYFLSSAALKACQKTGFNVLISGAFNDFAQKDTTPEKEYLAYNDILPNVKYGAGFHAEYTTSLPLMEEIASLSQKYAIPFFTHCQESEKETKDCIKKYGKTPVALFKDIGLFENGGAIFHGVYLTEEDMDILKEKNISLVSNPASNIKLANGIAPLKRAFEKGINIALGTDGAASNNALDMFREMYLACMLQKLKYSDASALKAEEVLRWACCNSAKITGFDNDCLREGKLADIIMIDMHTPNMLPERNIPVNLVYSGGVYNVKMTMVRGNILYYDDSFHMGEEIEKIYYMCK
ncbi:MAG: amidohydrolase [Firmicutes bacterium]|nr:amidohydrolase [Bacillota bacterium]